MQMKKVENSWSKQSWKSLKTILASNGSQFMHHLKPNSPLWSSHTYEKYFSKLEINENILSIKLLPGKYTLPDQTKNVDN